jgi:diacylglycerol kinase family enzyme
VTTAQDPRKQRSLLAHGHVVDVDLGVANGRHFANMASLGVSVAVSGHTPHVLKRRRGRVAYAMTGTTALATHRPMDRSTPARGSRSTRAS